MGNGGDDLHKQEVPGTHWYLAKVHHWPDEIGSEVLLRTLFYRTLNSFRTADMRILILQGPFKRVGASSVVMSALS